MLAASNVQFPLTNMSTTPWIGSATLSAVVALENARLGPSSENSPKTLYFDTHVYLSDPGKQNKPTKALALFRYFNQFDYEFEPNEVHICFVVVNVSQHSL